MKLSDQLTEKALIFASKVSSQKHMCAIKNAFTSLMPVIITGSFCTLITNVVCATEGNGISLGKLPGMHWLSMFTDWFNAANYATLNFFTVAAVVLIGLELGKLNKLNGFMPGIISLCSFISCLPTVVQITHDDVVIDVANVLGKDYTAARGLFLGIVIALVSVEIYTKLVNSGFLKITMPDSVPSNVAGSFNVLFPSMFTVLICALFNFFTTKVLGMSLYEIIYTFLQTPLEKVMQGLPGLLVLMLVAQLFWAIGIHGNQIIKPVRDPLLNAAILANTDLVAQGITDASRLNIINMSFWDTYMSLGGSGCTIGLLIAIFLFSKRGDYRAIAKLEVAPAIFEINEPMTFGLPIVLNPLLVVPFIITPLVTGTFAYIMTKIGFAGVCVYAMPWTTPPVLSAWLSTGGSIGAIITQLICVGISIAIYMPFVILANKAEEAVG
ncbi:MAG: PTS sugar transporter subunit IIC [Hungatella sp.]|jgi:PTS system cellobiose-specific IIC component|nr:PTS sugar transporter subunit IIC [Hungatella sp.]MCI9501288.1 PTS sugar transporter subunit IIC [Hungatella sp.]MCI9636288.1 PTS sugar transporter subunit IIC [Hungatella sp.]